MKKIFIACLLFSVTSFASYLESCDFQAVLKNHTVLAKFNDNVDQTTPFLIVIEITKLVKDNGSHNPLACQNQVGQMRALEITYEDYNRISTLTVLNFSYSYINGMTPNGVVSNTSWRLQESL